MRDFAPDLRNRGIDRTGYWQKMKIAIIEDEQIHTEFLARCLKEWCGKTGVPAEISTFLSAESFLFTWEEKRDFDILFVDIQMKAMNGMEMAEKVRQEDEDIAIVFTTGIADYMAAGYEVEAMHYLLKPVDREKIGQCMDKLVRRRRMEPCVTVHGKGEVIKLPVGQVTYIEAQAHSCVAEVFTRSGQTIRHEVAESITEMERLLTPYDFIRCHRSYLCRTGSIYQIGRSDITLDSGSVIPVSRRMYGQVNQAFIRHFHRFGMETERASAEDGPEV